MRWRQANLEITQIKDRSVAPRRLNAMLVSSFGILVGAGLALGIVGAVLAARVIQGLLFGIEPHDPVTLMAVALLMGLIGIAACWIPALRAARIDPALTMRS